MLIGVIQKSSLAEIAAAINNLASGQPGQPAPYDMLELRLDGCTDFSLDGVAALPRPLPVLFTLRRRAEGGAFTGSEDERLKRIEALMTLEPDFMDVEAAVPAARIARIRAVAPRVGIVLSWHDFTATPEDLAPVLARMRDAADDVIYKMAAFARTSTDALRMLTFCRAQQAAGLRMVGISMGECGVSSRILAPVVHEGWCYCPVAEATAPGQLDAHTLREVYNVAGLTRHTAMYGLIGDPVEHSIGHIWHNAWHARQGLDAVYVKWHITREDLPTALPLLAQLGVRGLSVTMPHKEAVLPLLTGVDATARMIGAANTLRAQDGGFFGTNTDGAGALHALPLDVRGKKLVVLGAGGAARALIHAAASAGAEVTVFNRTPGKPLPAAPGAHPPAVTRAFAELPTLRDTGYDAIVNALPFDVGMPMQDVPFLPGRVAMDLSYGKPGAFLARAREAGCRVVDGRNMYEHQAALQRDWWK